MICPRCNWYVPDDCTCRMDRVARRQLWLAVEARHRAAVKLARFNAHRRRLRADRELRRSA